MKPFIKKYVKTIRLDSYHPLCGGPIGMRAVNEFGLLPFLDGSCRREPDFESDFPSITTLCRQQLFAPNLWPNDIIIYITTKGCWLTDYFYYRLVAILTVSVRKESHFQAKTWYNSNSSTGIPSNCIVDGNKPLPFHLTAGNYQSVLEARNYLSSNEKKQALIGERRVALWDKDYRQKSNVNGTFIITKPIYVNLLNPSILTDSDMRSVFGKVPNTRNPNIIRDKEVAKRLMAFAGVDFLY